MRSERSAMGTALAVAILLLVIVAGAGAYLLSTSNTPSTSSSSTSTSTTSTTTTSTTSTLTSCTTPSMNLTTSGSPQGDVLNFSRVFASFSEMAVHWNGTSYDGNTPLATNGSSDYHVISRTANGYKVNVTVTARNFFASGANVTHFTDFVLKNGTALSVLTYAAMGNYYAGNHTALDAIPAYAESMYYYAGFYLGSAFSQLPTSGSLHVTGTGTVMLGPTQVSVTNYAPDALPLIVNHCGTSVNFTKFSLQTGTVLGVSGTLPTMINVTGSFSVPVTAAPHEADISFRITSITS